MNVVVMRRLALCPVVFAMASTTSLLMRVRSQAPRSGGRAFEPVSLGLRFLEQLALGQERGGGFLGEPDNLIGLHVVELLDVAGRPADLDGIDLVMATEAEVEAMRVLAVIAIAAFHFADLGQITGDDFDPGADGIATDVCVPISRLADCVAAANDMLEELGLVGLIVGHVGDGNFHTTLLVDMKDDDEK